MKFVIVLIEEDTDEISLVLDKPLPILIDVSGVQERTGDSGSGSSTDSRVFNFVNADLAPNGSITFTHDLNQTYVDVSVYSPLLGEVFPDSVNVAFNSVTVNLGNFRDIVGTWTVLLEV